MDRKEILSHVDHTLLKPEATWPQIRTLCDEAIENAKKDGRKTVMDRDFSCPAQAPSCCAEPTA